MAAHPVVGPAGDWHREILREVVTGTGESRALTEYQHDPLGFVVDVLGVRREDAGLERERGLREPQSRPHRTR